MTTPDPANFPAFVAAGEALTDLIRTGPDGWRSLVGGSTWNVARVMARLGVPLSLIHISEPTRLLSISYAVFCLKKKSFTP